MPAVQSYKNHARWDTIYHFIILPVLVLNVVVAATWYGHHAAAHAFTGPWVILVAIVLFLLAVKARMFALRAQDRAIRIEERLRLASLALPSQLAELESLTTRQLIALRFASNAEVVDLARRAVREALTTKQIKQAIVSWRPDNERV